MMIKGETKNIKIFTRDVFIADRNVAEFELEKLQKCSIANAIRILYYNSFYISFVNHLLIEFEQTF